MMIDDVVVSGFERGAGRGRSVLCHVCPGRTDAPTNLAQKFNRVSVQSAQSPLKSPLKVRSKSAQITGPSKVRSKSARSPLNQSPLKKTTAQSATQ
eukprot:scaffold12427_cov51-Cyclotella_meneghiniana.AAC.2